jgi:16S rRNA (guanine527-N7)-methyltransferase
VASAGDPRVLRRLEILASEWALPAEFPGRIALLLELVRDSPHSLTSVRDPIEAVEAHVADSLTGLSVPELRAAERLADIGSGAGFPGLVLAAALPGSHISLVESVGKKAAFTADAAEQIGLENVEAVPLRAEEWTAAAGELDVVTARALAPLAVLLEYAAPLLGMNGLLVAWKGRRDEREEAAAANAAELLGLATPAAVEVAREGAESRHLYLSRKVRPTPAGFPRRAGMPRTRPLAP